jgi:hypothetical protein
MTEHEVRMSEDRQPKQILEVRRGRKNERVKQHGIFFQDQDFK